MSETKLELKMHDTTFCDHYILWPIVFAFISFIHHPVKSKLIKSSKLIGYTFDSDFGLNKKGTEETIRKCLQGHFVLLDPISTDSGGNFDRAIRCIEIYCN